MAYKFQSLPQLVDMRGKLAQKGSYPKRTKAITHRVWHHSLTKKHLGGSDAESFADYHVGLGWPGCGYTFVIEPKNVINTPNGKRARVVQTADISQRTYHVGDSNQFSLGVCVAGDYRYDTMDDATIASIADLHKALVADNIGEHDTSHNEMPGYSWKACCEYDYRKLIKWQGEVTPTKPAPLPESYTIQEGDSFWSIAHKDGAGGLTVADLIAANPRVDPTELQIGQKIVFGKARAAASTPVKHQPSTNYVKKGSKGEEVKRYQRILGINADGDFGSQTDAAVRKFQKRHGLTADGIIGAKTKEKLLFLEKYVGCKFPGRLLKVKSPILSGEDVRIVQYILGVTADGKYGPKTAAAVKLYQSDYGIKNDGIVGQATWSKMF